MGQFEAQEPASPSLCLGPGGCVALEGASHCLGTVVSLQFPVDTSIPSHCMGNLVTCLPLAPQERTGQARVLHHTGHPSPQALPHSEAGIHAHPLPSSVRVL